MKVEFLQNWHGYRSGSVIEVTECGVCGDCDCYYLPSDIVIFIPKSYCRLIEEKITFKAGMKVKDKDGLIFLIAKRILMQDEYCLVNTRTGYIGEAMTAKALAEFMNRINFEIVRDDYLSVDLSSLTP